MSKTKQLSQYNGTAWETPIDIGADAANVDYPLSDDTTKPLDEVIGSVGASDSNLVTQISNKLSTNGAIDNTVLNQGPDITTYPTSGQVNDGNLVVSAEDSSHTLWSKFNAFRGRVASNFSNYIKATLITSGTGVSSSATDAQVYSAKAIQNYFNSVIGYNSASDVSSLGSVASQLSSLNSNLRIINDALYAGAFPISSSHNVDGLIHVKCGNLRVIYGTITFKSAVPSWSNTSTPFTVGSDDRPRVNNVTITVQGETGYFEIIRTTGITQSSTARTSGQTLKISGIWAATTW